MKKIASEIKVGDTIVLGGIDMKVISIENSDIGKQGSKKTRIEASNEKGEKIAVIRPSDYPLEVK